MLRLVDSPNAGIARELLGTRRNIVSKLQSPEYHRPLLSKLLAPPSWLFPLLQLIFLSPAIGKITMRLSLRLYGGNVVRVELNLSRTFPERHRDERHINHQRD